MTTGVAPTAREMAATRAGSSTRQTRVGDAVVVGDGGQRLARARASSSVRPSASDRPQIAERLARVARQVEPVALGLRGGVLVGEDARRRRGSRARGRRCTPRWSRVAAGLVGERHPVHVKDGRVVGDEDAVGEPLPRDVAPAAS